MSPVLVLILLVDYQDFGNVISNMTIMDFTRLNMTNGWTLLLIAGFFEIFLALGLKFSNGFTSLAPTIGNIVATILSFFFLSQSLKYIPLGTAYAVWTGIGAADTVVVSIILLGENVCFSRLFCIFLIICGVVGLKLCKQ